MKDYIRYAIGVGMLILAIVVMVVLFNIIRNTINDGGDKPQESSQNQSKVVDGKKVDLLAAPTSNQSVRFTTRGAVYGNERHFSIRITVDRNTRLVEVVQGYDQTVVKSQSSPNTQDSYKAFVEALNGAGFTKSVDAEGRGAETQTCPLGYIYSFEVAPGTNSSFRTWSNSCKKAEGTSQANRDIVQQLFQRQIPDYDKFVQGVRLS